MRHTKHVVVSFFLPLTVYGAYLSTYSRSILLFLSHYNHTHPVKIDFKFVEVDIMTGANLKPEFVKINPAKKIPCIDDDGFVLSETSAILKYLGEKYNGFYPKDLKAKAMVNSRMDWFNTELYPELAFQMTFPQIFPFAKRVTEEVTKAVVERGKGNTEKWLTLLNDIILDHTPFLAGNEMTIADILGICLITAGEYININFAKYAKIKVWMDKMKALPTYNDTFKVHFALYEKFRVGSYNTIS